MLEITGKTKEILISGHHLTFCNQSHAGWTHPYPWQGRGDLHSSGCGIFSLCHAAQWLTGSEQAPEFWADFSVQYGGRGDDGTDRPALLHALMAQGCAEALGFSYQEDGLLNDQEALWRHMYEEHGAAFCNLRVGHIVTLADARVLSGERQYLVIDSASESSSERIRDALREMVPGTEIIKQQSNASGLITGYSRTWGCYWVAASQPKDFNLLHRIRRD